MPKEIKLLVFLAGWVACGIVAMLIIYFMERRKIPTSTDQIIATLRNQVLPVQEEDHQGGFAIPEILLGLCLGPALLVIVIISYCIKDRK